MPYFPELQPAAPYFCPRCEAWYIVLELAISCCVIHLPGTCCHFNEEMVEMPQGETE